MSNISGVSPISMAFAMLSSCVAPLMRQSMARPARGVATMAVPSCPRAGLLTMARHGPRVCLLNSVMASRSEEEAIAVGEQCSGVVRAVVFGPRRAPILILDPCARGLEMMVEFAHDANRRATRAKQNLKLFGCHVDRAGIVPAGPHLYR